MKYINSSADLDAHCRISEIELIHLYLEAKENNPKSEDISHSLYLTILAIDILERIGNTMPTQAEIDCIELHIKRYTKKKLSLIPNYLKNVA
ncbi:MAG TPA: hypothetical protein VHE99_10345 [Gammaproteobacteria bacterium]|nr:hypothetical protein [Gammaproteobacteria bacterium]